MHPDVLVKALAAIVPKTTPEKFREAAGIASRSVAKSVLDFLYSNNIGTIRGNSLEFSRSDRLYTAILAVKMGSDIEIVSAQLSWKDFERLASEVLASFGYKTQTNVHLTKPHMEVDVIGVSSGFAVAVDCKHWKKSNLSSISAISRKQAERADRLPKWNTKISRAVPVVMTLHTQSVKFAGAVPVVPVHKFRSFVMDVKAFLPEIYVAD